MSLIPCRSCERPLSKDAKTCPNCGAKKPTKHKKPTDYRRLGKLLLILLAVYVVAIILSKALGLKSNTSSTSESSNPVPASSQYSKTHEKCPSQEKTDNLYSLMQEMVVWDKSGKEPIIATFKSNYWNDSFPKTGAERQKVIEAIANTDFCLNARPRTIYIFDSKGNMIGRATPQRGIEFLYLK
jgi:hypothetical protein